MPVPLLDLKQQYASIRDEVLRVTHEVYDSQHFILGKQVEDFERDFAAYCRTPFAVGLSSGTDALLIALMVLGAGEGHEVIVPAYSFFATAGVVDRLGATPVFVDIDLDDYNIDVKAIEARITSKTIAIMPVHLYGQMAAMEEVNRIAAKRANPQIGDAPHAEAAASASARCMRRYSAESWDLSTGGRRAGGTTRARPTTCSPRRGCPIAWSCRASCRGAATSTTSTSSASGTAARVATERWST